MTRLDAVVDALESPLDHAAGAPVDPLVRAGEALSNTSEAEFKAMVVKAKDYIAAGDAFQIVLSQRFTSRFDLPAFSLYRALRRVNPSPYLCFLDFGGFQIVVSSPEILVRVRDGKVVIRPIAGTRPRGSSPTEDEARAAELLADPKERAEHLMLLDLGRNDVGRVAKIGTVKVTDSFFIERYSHVMHIVSNVEGELSDGVDAVTALAAGFPAGTVSGAPKVRAMQIIDELEKDKRGIYAGCIGYFGAGGEMDTCIVLRASVVKDGLMHVQAGAGIVYDSSPAAEQKECVDKARALSAPRKKRCGSRCGESAGSSGRSGRMGFSRPAVDQSGRDRKCLLGCIRPDPSDRLPMPSSQLPGQIRLVLKLTAISAAIGAAYAQMRFAQSGGPAFALYSMARGAVTGVVIGGSLSSLEVLGLAGPLGSSLRRAPFTLHVALKTGIYLIVILFALALGAWAFPARASAASTRGCAVLARDLVGLRFHARREQPSWAERAAQLRHRPLLPAAAGGAGLSVHRHGRLDRAAERLGPLAFHRLLNRFVLDLTEPIVAAHGEIHTYVGDEVIATWKLEDGKPPARSVTACFAAIDRLAQQAPDLPPRVRRRRSVSAPGCIAVRW